MILSINFLYQIQQLSETQICSTKPLINKKLHLIIQHRDNPFSREKRNSNKI
jgi:hypothetical protein